MEGFFAESKLVSKVDRVGHREHCGRCGLVPFGRGRKKEKPYHAPVRNGILLVGGSSLNKNAPAVIAGKDDRRLMRSIMEAEEIDFDECGRANAVSCYSATKPTEAQIAACRPRLVRIIREEKPRVIVLLGSEAVRGVLGWTWKAAPGGLGQWAGNAIPDQETNAWIVPTWHPGEIADDELAKARHFRRHIAAAASLAASGSRPWKVVPDYAALVSVEMSPSRAAARLRQIPENATIAFDYECTCLKPEAKGARIVCCAVRWEGETIAFPWAGDAIAATSGLLRSNRPKFAANMKFEERWTRRILGHRVKNWLWDTMLAAHIIDNRQGTHGLKFQAYALLGLGSYDEHIHPYLVGKHAHSLNNIHKIDMRDLLLYCGLDSFTTYEIAQRQMRSLSYEAPKPRSL